MYCPEKSFQFLLLILLFIYKVKDSLDIGLPALPAAGEEKKSLS